MLTISSMALIQFIKVSKVELKRTASQYTLQFGVSKTLQQGTLSEIRSTYFSLNLHEATSNIHYRVLKVKLF